MYKKPVTIQATSPILFCGSPPQNILLLLSQVNYNGTILVPEIEENNEYQ
jgi:hypothetical protein